MSYKVTIAVPIYNVEKYIERCVISLFEQTFSEIHYVFINDCSPDKSIEILKKVIESYPNKKDHIEIIHHEKNKGLAAARITGINAAKGDFILNIDSDDFIDLNTIELMYNKAISEKADIVVCDFLMDWGKKTKVSHQGFSMDSIEYTNLLLSAKALPGIVNKLIRTSLFIENKIYPKEGVDMGEDYSTTPRLTYFSKKIGKINLPLYHYSQINENAYTKKYSEKSTQQLIQAINILDDFFNNVTDKDVYKISLLQGKLLKKITLLMYVPSKKRKEIANLFTEANQIISVTKLPFPEKMVIKLANKNLFILLDIFIFLYKNVLELVQIIKGRRQ